MTKNKWVTYLKILELEEKFKKNQENWWQWDTAANDLLIYSY